MLQDLVDSFSLKERVAVVVGAASGIGRDTAVVLAGAGARVVLADRNPGGMEETAAIVRANGGITHAKVADVAVRADIDALAAEALTKFGRIDVWVNVAAVVTHTPVFDVTEEEMDRQIAVNQKGVYWGCVAAGRAMREQGSGSIINISSTGADQPPIGTSVYAMTKAAVNVCTRACANEFGPLGIRVNGVGPGFIYTPMTRAAQESDPARRQAMLDAIAGQAPLRKIGEPRDIAMAILYLASDASRFVTGQILRPNGGIAMP